jgi:predicted transcriptional regulator
MGITSVRLQPEVEEGLEAIAGKLQRTKSWLINQALREYINREEVAKERWEGTLSALKSLSAGRVVEADDVHNWLDSWGSAEELLPPTPPRT